MKFIVPPDYSSWIRNSRSVPHATTYYGSKCEFQDINFEIEEQIIIGGSSSRIRKRALGDPTYNLAAMLLDGF